MENIEQALDRLFDVAKSDTGQSRRVANFLLAWWNGDQWGHFDVTDLFALDTQIGLDIARVLKRLAEAPSAIYADSFGRREDMLELIARWRDPDVKGVSDD